MRKLRVSKREKRGKTIAQILLRSPLLSGEPKYHTKKILGESAFTVLWPNVPKEYRGYSLASSRRHYVAELIKHWGGFDGLRQKVLPDLGWHVCDGASWGVLLTQQDTEAAREAHSKRVMPKVAGMVRQGQADSASANRNLAADLPTPQLLQTLDDLDRLLKEVRAGLLQGVRPPRLLTALKEAR